MTETLDARLDRLEAGHQDMQRKINEIADVVLGSSRVHFDGHVERSGGLAELARQSSNGGVRIKIPTWVTAMLVALIGLVGTIAAAIITVAGSAT